MEIAICLLTSEQNHLEEWLDHHINKGFKDFIIFRDRFDFLYGEKYQNVNIIDEYIETPNEVRFQMDLYLKVCKKHKYDYILFIDSDEYLELSEEYSSIQDFILKFRRKHPNFDGIGINWRMYGDNDMVKTRNSVDSYIKYYRDDHIKTLVDPSKVKIFMDPHLPTLNNKSHVLNEKGEKIATPIKTHSSDSIWIKHLWTRSLEEWKIKVQRRGWYQFYDRKMEQFYEYNNKCTNI